MPESSKNDSNEVRFSTEVREKEVLEFLQSLVEGHLCGVNMSATPIADALHCSICSNKELGPSFCAFINKN